MIKNERLRNDKDPGWSGWTRDLKLLPLEQMERDGYTIKELEDKRGKFWEIIRVTLVK